MAKWTKEEQRIVLDGDKSGYTSSDISTILSDAGFSRSASAVRNWLCSNRNTDPVPEDPDPFPGSLTPRQRECTALYVQTGSEKEVAETLELDIPKVRETLWAAHLKGVDFRPDRFSPVAPVGFNLKKSTVQHRNGEEMQRWDRVAPASELFDESWEPKAPDGYKVKKSTIQIDSAGRIVQQWSQLRADEERVLDFEEFCRNRITPAKSVDLSPKKVKEEFLLEVPIFDLHHGMLAWGAETGENYDHRISRHLQVSAAKILFEHFGAVNTAVIYLGGDNQHIDNMQSETTRSGNRLDSDSRYARIAWCVHETNVTTIEEAKKFAKKVIVFVLSGNHDDTAAIHLAIQLQAYFRNDPQVTIRTEPELHKFFQWQSNAFCITHGHTNDKRIATYALQQVIRRNMLGVERVMVRMGHLHKRHKTPPMGLTEEDGVVIERFPTLAAQEAYSVEGAYTSLRATSAILWHDKWGRYGGREISLGEILNRFPIPKKEYKE